MLRKRTEQKAASASNDNTGQIAFNEDAFCLSVS